MPSRPHAASRAVPLAAAVFLAACQASTNIAPTASGSVLVAATQPSTLEPTPTTKPDVAPPPTDFPTDGSCEAQHICLGLLKAGGSYDTTAFRPKITFTVPDSGWENIADAGGVFQLFSLSHPGDVIAFFRNPFALDLDGKAAQGVGQSVRELAAWMAKNDQLETTAARSVTVGGLTGVAMDLKVASTATPTDSSDCPTRVCVPIIAGKDPSPRPTWEWDWGLAGTETARLYLVTSTAGVVAILVDSRDPSTFAVMKTQSAQILQTLKFG